jgi:tyrosyl-tRNA synthetase
VKRFLNFFTDIDSGEIDNLFIKEKNINNLKILLANETTKILHGIEAAKNAEKTAKDTFESGGIGMDLPEIKIKKNEVKKGIKILDLLSSSKIMSSKSDARRAIKNNSIKIDNCILTDDNKIIGLDNFKQNILKISFGKKKHYLIKII